MTKYLPLFLILLILVPVGITLDVLKSDQAQDGDFPIPFTTISFLILFTFAPFASRYSSLSERWRKLWKFTAATNEILYICFFSAFLILLRKELSYATMHGADFSERKPWQGMVIILGPSIVILISSFSLLIYDFLKKENGNFAKTRSRLVLLFCLAGFALAHAIVQLHMSIVNPRFESSSRVPESFQYTVYGVYAFVLYEWIRNRKAEGGKNGAVLFFAAVAIGVDFLWLFPNVYLCFLGAMLLFLPVLWDKKHPTELSVLLFAAVSGVFFSRFLQWKPEVFVNLPYYRFDHHLSLFLVFFAGREISEAIPEIKAFRSESRKHKILFVYREILFVGISVWAVLYDLQEGVHTSQFGILSGLFLHFSAGVFGYIVPILLSTRDEIRVDPKVWFRNLSHSVPLGLLIAGVIATLLFGGSRTISIDSSSYFVGSSAEEIKNILGPPDVENASTLKYFKVKTDNSPGADPETSVSYLLEFDLFKDRKCAEIAPGTVRKIKVRLRTGDWKMPYGSIHSSKLKWFGISGFDEENISQERLRELIVKAKHPIYTSSEDTDPTLGKEMIFNLPGNLKGEIVPSAFRYQKKDDDVILDQVWIGAEGGDSCLINKTKKGVLNVAFDPALFSELEWGKPKEFFVTENSWVKAKPEETAADVFSLPKGMALTLQFRRKEPGKLGNKTGTWFHYKGFWIFDSVLKEISLATEKDYVPLNEEEMKKNGASKEALMPTANQVCVKTGNPYEPKPGSFVWSLQDKYVSLPFRLQTNSQGVSMLAFGDTINLRNFGVESIPENLRIFSEAIVNSRRPPGPETEPFVTTLKGRLNLNFTCSDSEDAGEDTNRIFTVFKVHYSDFKSPKEGLLSFGSFSSFRKEFFLYFDGRGFAEEYCGDLGLELIRAEELEKVYTQKEKFSLPLDSEYKAAYWQADQTYDSDEEKGSGILRRAICVKR